MEDGGSGAAALKSSLQLSSLMEVVANWDWEKN